VTNPVPGGLVESRIEAVWTWSCIASHLSDNVVDLLQIWNRQGEFIIDKYLMWNGPKLIIICAAIGTMRINRGKDFRVSASYSGVVEVVPSGFWRWVM